MDKDLSYDASVVRGEELFAMTNAELRALMDKNEVAYESDDNKRDLVGKIIKAEGYACVDAEPKEAVVGETPQDSGAGAPSTEQPAGSALAKTEPYSASRSDTPVALPARGKVSDQEFYANMVDAVRAKIGDDNRAFLEQVKQAATREVGDTNSRLSNIERRVDDIIAREKARNTHGGSISDLPPTPGFDK